MNRRIRWLLALLLLVAASFLLPAVHWRVIGWVKGEAFYQGRPTSYWSSEIQRILDNRPTFTRRVTKAFGVPSSVGFQETPVKEKDIAIATPVLLELLRDRSYYVRYYAAYAFYESNAEPALVIPRLIELLAHEDPMIQYISLQRLAKYGAKARAAVPSVLPYLRNPDPYFHNTAADTLRHIDPEAAAEAGVIDS